MSVDVMLVLVCDGCQFRFNNALPSGQLRQMRDLALDHGWTRPFNPTRDLCPSCTLKERTTR